LLKVLTYSVQKTQRGHKVSMVWGTSGGRPARGPGGRWAPPAEATVWVTFTMV